MATQYQIHLTDPLGNMLAIVDQFVSLSYARAVNTVGQLMLTVPDFWDSQRNLYIFDLFNQPDNRIEVWRQVDGSLPSLEGETPWIINDVKRTLTTNGERAFTILAADFIQLLERRFVLYVSGSAQATKTAALDDMLKSIWNDNLGSGAGASLGRNISTYVQQQANLTLAPSGSKSFAWQNVLKAMQAVCQQSAAPSAATPTYLAFDIVYITPNLLEFRTYVNQRGIDHRFSPFVSVQFDPDFGNMGGVQTEFDYRVERNFVEVASTGVGSLRITATAEDDTRISQSPLHRIEQFYDARNTQGAAAATQAEADFNLRQGRAKIVTTGTLVQTPASQYGVHYDFGDVVVVNNVNLAQPIRLDGIGVKVENGQENISGLLIIDPLLGVL